MWINKIAYIVNSIWGFLFIVGGAKVWECTQDLGLFLANTVDEKNLLSDFAEKRVLDLGCGAGILGILALKAGSTVHFQDYVSFDIPFICNILSQSFIAYFLLRTKLFYDTSQFQMQF